MSLEYPVSVEAESSSITATEIPRPSDGGKEEPSSPKNNGEELPLSKCGLEQVHLPVVFSRPRAKPPAPKSDGTEKYSIQGPPKTDDGKPGIRRNIIDFSVSTNPSVQRQWNLYLQAMQNFQKCYEDDSLSYYQIAGIHGAPFIHWMETPEKGDRPGNYCTHGTSIFLTWHRPYLLLFEQRIVEEAVNYAQGIENSQIRALYVEDAKRLRIPYWDWAYDYKLPQPVRDPEIDITLPDSEGRLQSKKIDNPLYAYKFKDQLRITRDFGLLDSSWLSEFMETKRCPGWDSKSHPEVADKQLGEPHDKLPTDFRAGIYHLLTQVHEYGPFSNTGYWKGKGGDPKDHFTLESYHNSIHNYTGTDYTLEPDPKTKRPPPTGHMSEIPVSAFDPIFWLHHANIDRLYAMWQAINYDALFQGQVVEPTRLPHVDSLRAEDSATTGLRPFYTKATNSGRFETWNSAMVQASDRERPCTSTYGYTYTDIPADAEDPESLKRTVLQAVQKHYGPRKGASDSFHKLGELPEGVRQKDLPEDVLEHIENNHRERPAILTQQRIAEFLVEHERDDKLYKGDYALAVYRRSWIITLFVKRYLVKGNFTIFFFLGQPDEDTSTWSTSFKQVGSFSTLKSRPDNCINCARQEESDAILNAGIDITESLYEALPEDFKEMRGILNRTSIVVKWLTKNLQWRILEHDTRKSIDLSQALRSQPNGLVVKVASHMVPYPIAPFRKSIERAPATGADGTFNIDYNKYKIFDSRVHTEVTKRRRDVGGYFE